MERHTEGCKDKRVVIDGDFNARIGREGRK